MLAEAIKSRSSNTAKHHRNQVTWLDCLNFYITYGKSATLQFKIIWSYTMLWIWLIWHSLMWIHYYVKLGLWYEVRQSIPHLPVVLGCEELTATPTHQFSQSGRSRSSNYAVSNCTDLTECTKTMRRHDDCKGQIADFRDSFEIIKWLHLHFKCEIKTKTHFDWVLWQWSVSWTVGLMASWVAKWQLTSWRSGEEGVEGIG